MQPDPGHESVPASDKEKRSNGHGDREPDHRQRAGDGELADFGRAVDDAAGIRHGPPGPSDPTDYWNVELPNGRYASMPFRRDADPSKELPAGYRVVSGPYDSLIQAMCRERSDLFYAHIFRQALERGIITPQDGKFTPTFAQIAKWTGYSVETVQSWLRPMTDKSRRAMPRRAIRLVIHEFMLRDRSSYGWKKLLRLCD